MLRIEQLQVSYGETQILRNVDLEVGPGEVVCLMGRNGVGKTTLLKSIMGLLRPRAGRVWFEGRDLTRAAPYIRARGGSGQSIWSLKDYLSIRRLFRPGGSLALLAEGLARATPEVQVRGGIGYVPQGREIFPHLTVLENLQIGLLANPARPRTVPEQVFEYFPKLKILLNRKGGFLSGGEQQQLAIARALVAAPRLLILDEPTEGIQPNIITLIGQVLRALKQAGQMSVLLVEQYFEFALKLADRYYVMEKGSIVLHGSSADLDKEAIKPYLAF